MANKDNRRGLEAVDHLLISGYCGKQRPYYVDATYATALYVGDPVVITGTSNTARLFEHKAGTLPTVEKATAGDANAITGIITGIKLPNDGNAPFDAPYRKGLTEALVMVNDDPYTIFAIQADSANAVAATDISSNANVVYTHAGDNVTGRSGAELNTASMTTTATYQLKILGSVDSPDNELGTNAKLLVTINNHSYAKGVVGV